MKQKQLIFCMGLSAIALLTSCNEREFEFPSEGKDKSEMGKIVLNLNADASFSVQTRALNEADYRNTANYTVQLLQGTTVLETYTGPQSSLNFTRELGSNNTYTVKAFYGVEEAASRDNFYVEGSKTITLTSENPEQTISLICTPTCGKVSVDFSSEMNTYYDDFSVTYGGTSALGTALFTWAKNDTEPWYVKLNPYGEELTYTINLKVKDQYAHVDEQGNKQTTGTVTGTFVLQRNCAHKLSVQPSYTPNSNGTFRLEIVIDEGTNDIVKTIQVPVEWI